MASLNKNKTKFSIPGDKLVLIGAIIAVFVVFTALNKNFLSSANMINIAVGASLVGLIAIAHTFLIIAGMNDLSSGSVVAFAGVLAALLVSKGYNFFIALLITVLASMIAGLFNAWMTNKIRLEAFIATLVTQSVFRGLAYILCGGKAVPVSDPLFITIGKMRFIGIPFSVWLLVICLVIFGVVLARTQYGRSIYAIGGNREAARLAGLNPNMIVLKAFILMSILCGIGGTVLSARMNSGMPTASTSLEFDSITAVVLGGTSMSGGVGSMSGTILGVILIQAFNTGLTMVNVPTFYQYLARGALLLFALTSDYLRKSNREQMLIKSSMKAA